MSDVSFGSGLRIGEPSKESFSAVPLKLLTLTEANLRSEGPTGHFEALSIGTTSKQIHFYATCSARKNQVQVRQLQRRLGVPLVLIVQVGSPEKWLQALHLHLLLELMASAHKPSQVFRFGTWSLHGLAALGGCGLRARPWELGKNYSACLREGFHGSQPCTCTFEHLP